MGSQETEEYKKAQNIIPGQDIPDPIVKDSFSVMHGNHNVPYGAEAYLRINRLRR